MARIVGDIRSHARLATDVRGVWRATDRVGRRHPVVLHGSCRRPGPVSRVSSWLNGRALAINADDINAATESS